MRKVISTTEEDLESRKGRKERAPLWPVAFFGILDLNVSRCPSSEATTEGDDDVSD